MRNLYQILLISLFTGASISAQVKIGDNPQNIDPSSVLELESTDKVLVITRVTTAQMNSIVPSQGALCFNTDLQSVHYYDGMQWVNLGGGGTGGPLTADAIVNTQPTIVITPTATGDNLEVAPNSIRSEQIVDGGVNGVDIQDGSIGPGKLQDFSVTQEKLSENSVGAFALDNDNIGVSAFNNDAGYITAGDITSISADAGNAITAGSDGGAFYDDTNLLMDVMDNAADIAADNDQSPANEIQNPTLTGTILGLTNTAGTVDLGPLISAGGSDNQNLEGASLDAMNMLTIDIEDGTSATVDLSSLAGGTADGSETIINPTATVTVAGTGTALDPYLLTAVGGGTGGTVISDATLTGDGSSIATALGIADDGVTTAKILDANVTDAKIAPGAADQILRTAPDGLSVSWVDLPAGGAVISDATLTGDGSSAATALGLADDAVTTTKILDANVTDAKIAPGAADQILRTAPDGLSVGWVDLPTGGAVISDATLIGDGSSAATALGLADDAVTTTKILDANVTDAKIAPGAADQILRTAPDGLSVGWVDLPAGGAVISDATLIGDGSSAATALGLADDAVTSAKILDANVTTAKIAPAADLMPAADQMLITNAAGTVEWAPAGHTGTAKSIFFADTDGTPTTADDNVNPDDDRGFFWDTDARQLGAQSFGALFIGLEPGNAQSNAAKVHIADNFPGVAYAMQLQNNSATVIGRTTGMLFSTEGTGSYGKGALVYEYQDTWARGDFHFLQRSDFGPGTDDNPDLTHRAFTIKNNSDIVLYGGIDVDGTGPGTGLGTAGQVLSSTGTGVEWINAGGSAITLAGDVTGLTSATQIATGAVNSAKILDGAIATEDVADDAITAAKIASDVAGAGLTQNVTTGALEIADDAITTGRILDGEVQTLDIADNNVTPAKIAEGTIGQVLTTDAVGDVVWAAPVAGAVTTDATIDGDGSLATPLSIANDAITTGKILDGEVQTLDIADNNVTPAKIAEGTNGQVLTTDAVGDVIWAAPVAGAVTTDATIDGDGSLATPLSVANDAITTGRILDGEVQTPDIADNNVTPAKIAEGTNGQVLTTDAVGDVIWAAPVAGAVTTDATIDGDGSLATPLSVANDAITTGRILDGEVQTADIADAAISSAKLAVGSVQGSFMGTSVIIAGTIGTADIGTNAIGNAEIQTGAVRTGEIFDGTITDVDIAAGAAIDGSKINPNFPTQIIATGGISLGADLFQNGNNLIPDYVFQKYFLNYSRLNSDYDFATLEEIESFVRKNHHLPGINSAAQAKKDGVWNLSKSNLQNLEKIEELFLHTIEQEKKIKFLKSENQLLKEELKSLQSSIDEIKSLLKTKE